MNPRIVPIVEGRSEQDAIPPFLRRILHDLRCFEIEPDRAIREHRDRLVKHDVFVNRLRMAKIRPRCEGIVVVFDADDDAACQLGPDLIRIAANAGISTRIHVVLAVREIESWIIAGIESLRGFRGIPKDLSPPPNAESIRGAKEWLDARMQSGYKPTIDLLPLLLRFDYHTARMRAPSLDRFLRVITALGRDVRS